MPAILQSGVCWKMSAEKENAKTEDMKDDVSVKSEEKVDTNEVKVSEDSKEKPETPKKRAAKLKDVKKKEESEEEEEEEDDGEDDEDVDGENDKSGDEKVPLLDQPLEISGARERKKVERFTEEFNEPKETKAIEIPKGKGTPLGEIPRTEAFLKKFKADALKPLHRVLFNRVGKVTLVRNNIRKFCGFDFDKGSDQYEKKKHILSKMEVSVLKTICCILDVEKKGKRDELVERILTFLLEPKSSGAPVPDSRPKRSTAQKANNKGYSESEDETEKRTPRSKRAKAHRKSLKEDSSDGEDNMDEDKKDLSKSEDKATDKEDESDKEDEEDEPDEEASSDDSESKSKSKKGRRSQTKKTSKKANAKKTPNKKSEKKSSAKKRKTSSKSDDESSSEDEPLSKKTKAPPTDEEIKSYVKEILEGANLEEITMKTVCKQVYAHYPDFDLAHKKDFIKVTVKSLIST
ncbi:protein DEK-like [Schistocerca nitens]|uniref:protein DEK-like n=1 Tax=Schistocerca cancellata TaxID=274614 RepID=UPI0021197F7F|nr:protein DEK-like [Schistocerca cancellata]XP_049788869.1 protein DEK-like [Schistocerca nitens]